MKKYTLRFRKTDKGIFNDIKHGLKTIETRAATDRFRPIKAGDILIFVCGKERFEKKVKTVEFFKSINKMAETLDFRKVMPRISSVKEIKIIYYSFPGYREKIKKVGLIALELK